MSFILPVSSSFVVDVVPVGLLCCPPVVACLTGETERAGVDSFGCLTGDMGLGVDSLGRLTGDMGLGSFPS